MAADRRVIAVLGYSRRGDEDIHATCLARVRRAEAIVEPGDLVLFTGFGRVQSEAELMARAWDGDRAQLFLDHDARSTAANARVAADYAVAAGANELVAVTSAWHRPRAALLLRAALWRSGVAVRVVGAGTLAKPSAVLRELAAALLLPVQLAVNARRARAR